eukprot:3375617-Rhodomonas_salina.1
MRPVGIFPPDLVGAREVRVRLGWLAAGLAAAATPLACSLAHRRFLLLAKARHLLLVRDPLLVHRLALGLELHRSFRRRRVVRIWGVDHGVFDLGDVGD